MEDQAAVVRQIVLLQLLVLEEMEIHRHPHLPLIQMQAKVIMAVLEVLTSELLLLVAVEVALVQLAVMELALVPV
jgi:hypothetical protein